MATELKLCIGMRSGRSAVTERYFTSPLKLGIPNMETDRLKVVLMMASAGILMGDEFCYDIACGAGTKTLLTEQSYTKIFDTGEGGANRRQKISLEDGASLYYRPCATIPFEGSAYDGDIRVSLKEGSEFAYADILAAGRVGMGERFAFRHYRNRLCVEVENRPVFLEHCLLEPAHMALENMVFFDGYTHQGTFYFYGNEEKQKKLLAFRPASFAENEGIFYGVSQGFRGVCVRVLANTAQDIENSFAAMAQLLDVE